MSLRHPLIASPIGFAESAASRRLKIARLYVVGDSLAEMLSDTPAWWTPTAKAKVIAGIALGLRFAHGTGLLHRGLKASNVLVDADRRIQIADFSPIRLEAGDAEPFSGEGWRPAADVCALRLSFLRSQLASLMLGPEPEPDSGCHIESTIGVNIASMLDLVFLRSRPPGVCQERVDDISIGTDDGFWSG